MKNFTKALVILLCLVLVAFSVVSCGKDPKETTGPDTTAPDTTAPDVTEPNVTEPDVTEPEVTEPDETLPDETLPDETLPDETLPDETQPDETEPEETTKPADTTKPAEPHKHTYTSVEIYPTCDTAGVITYLCSCGESYAEEGEPALGHAWAKDGALVVSATPCLIPDSQAYKCVSCGATEVRLSELVAHSYTVSTQLVSADVDPLGVGYELLACSSCDQYMKKVEANHLSGHKFAEDTAGFACACGTRAVDLEEIFGVNEVSGKTEIPAPSYSVVDGKLLASVKGQHSLQKDALGNYIELLSGLYAGNSLPSISYSFELSYTGTAPAAYGGGGSYFSWRSAPNNKNEVEFTLTDSDGKLVAAKETKAVLEPNETYTFTVTILPETAQISLTVKGKFMGEDGALTEQEIVLVKPKTMTVPANSLASLYYGRDGFNHENTETFALYMDNFTISYVKRETNEEGMASKPCDHTFESAPIVDLVHPLEEAWMRDTCTVCGRFFDRRDCEALGGHLWGETPIRVVMNDCVHDGEETYECLACGKTEVRFIPMAHNYYVFAGIVSAAEDLFGVGYELWGCPGCQALIKVEANHETGHNIDETGACKCGAVFVAGSEANLGKNNFSDEQSITVSGGKVADDVWTLEPGTGKYYYIYTKNNALLKDLLDGEYEGKKITEATISFDFKYTGALTGTTGGYAIQAGFENAINYSFTFVKDEATGYLATTESSNPVVLEPGKVYRFSIWMDVEGGITVQSRIDGRVQKATDLSKSGDKTWRVKDLSQVLLRGDRTFDTTMVIDNLSVDYVYSVVSEEGMQAATCTAHQWSTEQVEDKDLFRDTCELCGYYLEREGCNTAGHTWNPTRDEALSYAPTCTDTGMDVYCCIYCDAVNEDEIPSNGHSVPTTPTSIDPPTCDGEGMEHYQCENCDEYEETKSIPAAGHKWDDGTITTPYNCVQPGVITYTCTVCTTGTKTEDMPMGHAYVNFEGVVAKADDPRGVGYELYSCSGCGEAKKIAATHESGHSFDESGKCACGAKLVDEATLVQAVISEEIVSSNINGQTGYGANNAALLDATKGVRLSVDFKYEGDPRESDGSTASKKDTFFSWRFVNYPTGQINVNLDLTGEKMAIYMGANSTLLTAGEWYTLVFDGDVEKNAVVISVCAKNGGEPFVLGTSSNPGDKLANSNLLFTRPGNIVYSKDALFTFTIANAKLESIDLVPDETGMGVVACAHDWTRATEGEVDTVTCELCDVFYTEESCAILGHAWAEDPYDSNVTCEGGTEIYACLVCGADDVRELGSADHVYSVYVSTTAAEGDVAGYETWKCTWCTETDDIEGNHYSGHTFDENNVCACGATASMQKAVLLFNDFTTSNELSLSLPNTVNGEWVVSGYNGQASFSNACSPSLVSLLSGTYKRNGETVNNFTFAHDMKYSLAEGMTVGELLNKNDTFFSWRSTGGKQELNLNLDATGDKLKIYLQSTSTKYELLPDVNYTLAYHFDVEEKTILVTLTGGEYNGLVLAEKVAANELGAWENMFFRATNTIYCANDEDFKFVIDNFEGYVTELAVNP